MDVEIMKIPKLQVIEFSNSQQAFHVQTLAEMLRDNLQMFHGRSRTDYYPIGICETDEEVQAFIEKAYDVLKVAKPKSSKCT